MILNELCLLLLNHFIIWHELEQLNNDKHAAIKKQDYEKAIEIRNKETTLIMQFQNLPCLPDMEELKTLRDKLLQK